jgi:hypothetical protein
MRQAPLALAAPINRLSKVLLAAITSLYHGKIQTDVRIEADSLLSQACQCSVVLGIFLLRRHRHSLPADICLNLMKVMRWESLYVPLSTQLGQQL